LGLHTHAAVDTCAAQLHGLRQRLDDFMHLDGQLAGRRKHQHTAGAGLVLREPGNGRQREGQGLAGSRLGDTENVVTGEGGRVGLFLDGRRSANAFLFEHVEAWDRNV
jgi:hypothetical protein